MTLSSRMGRWLTDRRNLSILVAILVGLSVAAGFRAATGADMASFLLRVTLAVAVPTAFDRHWSRADTPRAAAGWILVACGLATAVFAILYGGGLELAGPALLALW